MIQVKICCIKDIKEAQLALYNGASALGFVSEMPSGPGVIEESMIRSIISEVPEHISSFLLSSKTNSRELIKQLEYTRANTLQIVDYVKENVYETLRKYNPSIKIVQVIHVLSESDIKKALKVSNYVDMLLLDSGNPNTKVKTLGGTGLTHNWEISKRIVDEVKIPVFLAGGLNAANVKDAIEMVNPYGVDLCSGIRTNGYLDENKLKAFMTAVKGD